MAPFPSLSRAAVEIGVGALQGLISVGNVVDTTPTKTGYSKFSHGVASVAWPVTGRQAMLLIYTPAFLYALHKCAAFSGAWRRGALSGSVWAAVGSAVTNGREPLTAVLLFLHFGKRLAETLFLHRYSSKATDGAVGAFIGVYYLLTSLLVTWAQSGVPAATYNKSPAAALALVAGVGLYVVGQLGNLYHHYLLRALRDNNTGGSAATRRRAKRASSASFKRPSGSQKPSGGWAPISTSNDILIAEERATRAAGANAAAPTMDTRRATKRNICKEDAVGGVRGGETDGQGEGRARHLGFG